MANIGLRLSLGDVNLTLVWHTTVSIMVSTIVRTYKPGIWYLSWYSSILIHILNPPE